MPEDWLLQQTHKLSRQLQQSYSPSQKEALVLRLVGELAELMLPREVKPGEDQGRISGDVNWRKDRGELGSSLCKPVVWIPTEDEMFNGEFSLEYRYSAYSDVPFLVHRNFCFGCSASLDQYIRRSDNDSITKNLVNGVFQADSVFRKAERDWNMAYICRTGKMASNKIFKLCSLVNFYFIL